MTRSPVQQELLGVFTPKPSASLVGVLASLPLSFRTVTESSGAVHAVDGSRGWSRRSIQALRLGACAVVVEDPSPEVPGDVEALRAEASTRGVPVVLAEGWAGSAALAAAAAAWPDPLRTSGLVEVVLRGGPVSPVPQLLDVARVLRASGRPVSAETWSGASATVGVGCVAIVARAGMTTWSILLTRGPATRLSLSVSADADQVQVQLPSPETAAPGSTRRVTPTGEEGLEAVYETAHRAAWRRVAKLLAATPGATGPVGAAPAAPGGGDALAELISDLQAVRELADRLGEA